MFRSLGRVAMTEPYPIHPPIFELKSSQIQGGSNGSNGSNGACKVRFRALHLEPLLEVNCLSLCGGSEKSVNIALVLRHLFLACFIFSVTALQGSLFICSHRFFKQILVALLHLRPCQRRFVGTCKTTQAMSTDLHFLKTTFKDLSLGCFRCINKNKQNLSKLRIEKPIKSYQQTLWENNNKTYI